MGASPKGPLNGVQMCTEELGPPKKKSGVQSGRVGGPEIGCKKGTEKSGQKQVPLPRKWSQKLGALTPKSAPQKSQMSPEKSERQKKTWEVGATKKKT